jgi:GDP-4-dehydro-6-deoxy-D-mannose reductase
LRALVTGGNGFVGRHLVAELHARGHETVVAGAGELGPGDVAFELTDLATVRAAVERARPEIVFHLAAHASVADASRAPLDTYAVNIGGTANIVEAIRTSDSPARLLFVSSAEVYGVRAPGDMPLRETTRPAPATIYAASKLAAEAIVLASAQTYGLRTVVVRPFNLIGPGQSEGFAVAAFAHRLARIAAGGPPLFPVGNLTAQRDFLDVRDAARAFADLAERGIDGEIYNVCSGVPKGVAEVLRQLVFAARIGVEMREDPALMRPIDVPIAYGDNAKLRAATGWEPKLPLGRTLQDTYAAALALQEVSRTPSSNDPVHGG